jgi:phosphoglycolate phosphatase
MTLVMFDMDGTLIDTQALIAEHMARTFEDAGLRPPTPAEARRVIGLSLPLALGRLAGNDDPAIIDPMVDAYKAHYRASLVADSSREALFPGALDALNRLRGRSDTELGIATGKGLAGVERILALHGIAGHFVSFQTPDHNPSKPHPGMIHRAMNERGALATDTIMVGDTTFDIEMGKAAGAWAIGVSWGYHEADELLAAGADILIDTFDQLDAAIEQLMEQEHARPA